MRTLRLLNLSMLLTATALAQSNAAVPAPKAPPFTSSPPIEDRELYHSFLTSEAATFAANAAAKSSNPAGAAAIDQQTAARLQVTVQDVPVIDNVLRQASQLYAQLPARQQSIMATFTFKPDAAQVAGLADMLRLEATAKTVRALASQLPASSWAGLHGYITGAYKKTYQSGGQVH